MPKIVYVKPVNGVLFKDIDTATLFSGGESLYLKSYDGLHATHLSTGRIFRSDEFGTSEFDRFLVLAIGSTVNLTQD